jgi:hypothetical protein
MMHLCWSTARQGRRHHTGLDAGDLLFTLFACKGLLERLGLESLVVCIIRNGIFVIGLCSYICIFCDIIELPYWLLACYITDKIVHWPRSKRTKHSHPTIGILESVDQSHIPVDVCGICIMHAIILGTLCMTRCEASARCLRYLRLDRCGGHPVLSFRHRRRPQCKTIRQKWYVH